MWSDTEMCDDCCGRQCKKEKGEREKYTHERLVNELTLLLELHDFQNFLGMNGELFDELVALVTPQIEKKNTVIRDAIPASQRLSITLRYLATGKTFEDMKFLTAVSPQSIGLIETCAALINCLKEYTKLLTIEQEWKQIVQDFVDHLNLPNCLDAVDGKHVAIRKPYNSGLLYFNYKQFLSIVMLAVANANYELIMVHTGINWRRSDGAVISYTKFGQALADNTLRIPEPAQLPNSRQMPFAFLGDEAFGMEGDGGNFTKPYPQARLNLKRRIFNYRFSRARRVIENAFGVLVSLFGVLQNSSYLSPEKARTVALACCYLQLFMQTSTTSLSLGITSIVRICGLMWLQGILEGCCQGADTGCSQTVPSETQQLVLK
ncbi:uncharacterized protein GBIM_10108 [Gryllus bimaculatus]|nr:uncharacterized protein GBIM_10108 [Gryllus bimaculatus]